MLNSLKYVIGGIRRRSARVARDERGGEVLEYALILGLIVVVAITIIGTVGTKVLARWTSVNSSI
ncbi:MAG TPA: Flp family type IVb pilin [Tepidisphaeraceae bacterium]|nr:Flp family type IVb pilin [Tepidisphaeraceae bacterium]